MTSPKKKLAKLAASSQRIEASRMCSEWPQVLRFANGAFPAKRGSFTDQEMQVAVQTNVDLLILWLVNATYEDLLRREIEIGDRS